ncbi:MAG: DoxX family protein [Fuerstiella sp.]
MTAAKKLSKCVLAIFMIGAGTMHFVRPDFYEKIMPTYLPFHYELVLLSGICEVLLGILLVVPQYSRPAAAGIVVLLIAVFPANIHVYQHQELIPGSAAFHLLRLPLQAVLILWAYWHTKPTDTPPKTELS